MGNSGGVERNHSNTGKGAVCIGIIGLGIALLQVEKQKESQEQSQQWREEDVAKYSQAEVAQEHHKRQLESELRSIGHGVRQISHQVAAPPLVVATAVNKAKLSLDLPRQESGNATDYELRVGNSPIELVSASRRPLIDVAAVWSVPRAGDTVALSGAVMPVGDSIRIHRFPLVPHMSTVEGTLQVHFSDSIGFRGSVNHPFVITRSNGYLLVTIGAHDHQSWRGPSGDHFTN